MKAAITFEAESRDRAGKGAARALRRTGKIPAVLYSGGKESTHIALPVKELKLAYQRGGFLSKLVELKVGGKSHFAVPREILFHPVTDAPEHADFLEVTASSQVRVMVPVNVVNAEKSIGIKRGGVLNIVRHEIELLCKPDNIPAHIEIDILEANIGDSIHIDAIKLPAGVTPAIKRNFTVITIAGRSSKMDEEAAPAAVTAAAAPAAGAAAAAPAAADKGKDKK